VDGRQFQFEWDPIKANANVRKHGVAFELARTVFNDERLLTVADLEHSETDERWFSIGCASSGVMLSVVYLWSDADPARRKSGSFPRARRPRRRFGIIRRAYEQSNQQRQ
jgi:uncharacterized DUF497 family protein